MDITGIAKSHQADIQKTGRASSRLSDSFREQIAECARVDAAQNVDAIDMGTVRYVGYDGAVYEIVE